MNFAVASIGLTLTPSGPLAQAARSHHAESGRAAPVTRSVQTVAASRDGLTQVTVTAQDYAFDAPDSIPAGLTEIRLLNRGTEMHHAWLIRLDGGKRMSDLFAAMKPEAALPAWARDVGGPNTPGLNGESTAILRLAAGRYAMICVIPSPDGKAHVMKGMAKEVIVTPAPAATRAVANAEPRATTTMTLSDYAFGFSTPPGAPVGGTTPMAQGEENLITLDFTPGEYGLICFAPDAKDGKPHFVHGMVSQLTIR